MNSLYLTELINTVVYNILLYNLLIIAKYKNILLFKTLYSILIFIYVENNRFID